jgi:hypothetical protein
MRDNQRFSILTFPQFFDGTTLDVHIVVLPRDQNPLADAIVNHPMIPDAPPFADAQLRFTASVFDGLEVFPHSRAPINGISLPVSAPTDSRAVYEALAAQLNITKPNMTNSNADLAAIPMELKPPAARPRELTVKKYLPRTYREAFHFTRPRHANLVTDDSYHCAIRDGETVPGFERSPDVVSWGQVFAYLMRQPFIAARGGLVYHSSFTVDAAHFPDGGWLYIDLAADSDYRQQLDIDDAFIRRYAARIPRLVSGEPRHVFAAVQFPVLFKANAADPDPIPAANYDRLFTEAAEYDDGFAKIVHCRQPVNRDLLEEDPDGAYPVKDVGISLGWDDEEITDRYIRQMEIDPDGDMDGRLDAPLGVFGYSIDVRETAEPENPWESLNHVESRQPLVLTNPQSPGGTVTFGQFAGELPYQVYPMQVDGRKDRNYWLPMYFANWHGHSMVLPDPDAADIYQTHADVVPDPVDPVDGTGTGVSGPAAKQLNVVYKAGPITTQLRYGNNYQFRVRMQDLSGGAPDVSQAPINETPSYKASRRFKRYISPNQPRIVEIEAGDTSALVNSDTPAPITELNLRRPKLGYPAVVFTGKYTDPVQRLIDQANLGLQVDEDDPNLNAEHRVGLGIADPDVDRVQVIVEIASLKLDKRDSVSGREDYVHLYTTMRAFPAVNNDDYEAVLTLPIEYRDVRVLHTGDEVDLVDDFDLADDIDDMAAIILPTARTVRLTIRAVAEEKPNNADYYGVIPDDHDEQLDNRYGEPVHVLAYTPSSEETGLLVARAGVPTIQGIFLQPDLVTASDGRLETLLLGNRATDQRDNVRQLAAELELESTGLTLTGLKGERVVFGCSSRIRHTLGPDGSAVTFASKGELINHWLTVISFEIDRDWMWDALETRSFVFRRTKRFTRDAIPEESDVVVGDISLVRTVSFQSLHEPRRNSSRIVFIDAVEPKKTKPDDAVEPDFPDTIELNYTIEAAFKPEHAEERDDDETLTLRLPITTPPAQVPKIASAGIALSPYVRDEKTYSFTEVRRRHLWIEFEEPIKDPQDTYFARVLAIAPDQLLSRNDSELLRAPEESVLPIDPEHIRVVTPGATNDLAGLGAMQRMEKSTSSDRHYLLPLPPGLHAESDEMFGFFTYELRVGHFREPGNDDMVWTTAQGRFGRRLRATGIQHPAPTLTCMANRDDEKLWVTAPYAVAVHDGKNVTADPPRTELWALLYAQVKQADNKSYRNILLDDRPLDWRIQVQMEKHVDLMGRYTDAELGVLARVAVQNFKYEINAGVMVGALKLVDYSTKNKDATRYGTVIWSQKEVEQLLDNLGLELTSSLSVLVVETLPQITNIYEHISRLNQPQTAGAAANVAGIGDAKAFRRGLGEASLRSSIAGERRPSPVSDVLGHHRLLRTSPLTPVPPICPPE